MCCAICLCLRTVHIGCNNYSLATMYTCIHVFIYCGTCVKQRKQYIIVRTESALHCVQSQLPAKNNSLEDRPMLKEHIANCENLKKTSAVSLFDCHITVLNVKSWKSQFVKDCQQCHRVTAKERSHIIEIPSCHCIGPPALHHSQYLQTINHWSSFPLFWVLRAG